VTDRLFDRPSDPSLFITNYILNEWILK